jgi:hypothetical protein
MSNGEPLDATQPSIPILTAEAVANFEKAEASPGFIEVVNGQGRVISRLALQPGLRIGRAYDNDLILDDPHLAPYHAEVQQTSAGWQLVDLNSQNGVWVGRHAAKIWPLDDRKTYRLGATLLHIRWRNSPVEPEKPYQQGLRWQGWPLVLVSVIALASVTLLHQWLEDIADKKSNVYLGEMLAFFLVVLAWTGLWSFINHLKTGHSRFGHHLSLVTVAIVVASLLELLCQYLAFAFSLESLALFDVGPAVLILAGLIYAHVTSWGRANPAWLKGAIAGLAIAALGFNYFQNWQDTGYLRDRFYLSVLLPPQWRQVPAQDLTGFMGDIGQLQTQVDARREQQSAAKAAKKRALSATDNQAKPVTAP